MNYEASKIQSNESAELADSLKLEKFHKEIKRETKTVLIKHQLQFMNNSRYSFFFLPVHFELSHLVLLNIYVSWLLANNGNRNLHSRKKAQYYWYWLGIQCDERTFQTNGGA